MPRKVFDHTCLKPHLCRNWKMKTYGALKVPSDTGLFQHCLKTICPFPKAAPRKAGFVRKKLSYEVLISTRVKRTSKG